MSIAHRLRHRITIEQLATTRDEFGGVVESWGTVAIVPAEGWPLSGREFVAAQAEQARFTENAMDFQASFTFLNSKFKGLMTALRGD